ncbi:MAG TPA: serine hydrolase [Terracidiphilus sp.]|jgi:CubicO group peptidase (beta-lactamase class C family)|nr:serine hydrolase [Terracidiphilus sp.]
MVSVLFVVLGREIGAQSATHPTSADYVGTYADTPGHPVEILSEGEFFAVQDEAKYPLIAKGVDAFSTMYGPTLSFKRDAGGTVTGYEQDGKLHPRVSTAVTAESAALAQPRPKGKNSPSEYRYAPPADRHDGIAVGNIKDSALGVETADAIVHAILDGTYKDVHSVLLYQQGKLVMEEYFYGYSEQRPHQLRSATKSVVSALAGIAIDRGALAGADQTVVPQMSYSSYGNPDTRKSAITLGNFLSMSSGLDCNDHSSTSPGRETVLDDAPDWVKATLDLPMINDPGTRGFYCSGGVAVVGRTTENAVHQKLPEFARTNLFEPLGFARNSWVWNYDLTNADKEYGQIHLTSRDMLKLGILFAQNGRWHGKQIISSAWVHASLAEQSHVDNVSYGYFWWRPWLNVETPHGSQHVDVVAAQGNGGQKIYLVPQYNLVAVFTGGGYNASSTPPNTIMATIILPKLMKAAGHEKSSSPQK